MKYIDADKLTKVIEDKGLDCSFALKMERLDILAIIDELKQEQPQVADASKMEEVDLDALVNEAFDKYSSVDGYGQLSVSFNRAELYSFIKKITRKEDK